MKKLIKPTNEAETIILFEQLAEEMGYEIVKLQSPFPDAIIRNKKTKLEFSVEFEYLSKNYIQHRHPIGGCNMIICWRDNMGLESRVPVMSLFDYLDRKNRVRILKEEIYNPGLFNMKVMAVLGLIGTAIMYPFIKDSVGFIVWAIPIISYLIILLIPKSYRSIEIPF